MTKLSLEEHKHHFHGRKLEYTIADAHHHLLSVPGHGYTEVIHIVPGNSRLEIFLSERMPRKHTSVSDTCFFIHDLGRLGVSESLPLDFGLYNPSMLPPSTISLTFNRWREILTLMLSVQPRQALASVGR